MAANYKGRIETGGGAGVIQITLRDDGSVAGNMKVGKNPAGNTGFSGRWNVQNATFTAAGNNTTGLQGNDPTQIVELGVQVAGDFNADSAGGVINAMWNGNPHEWTFAAKRISDAEVNPGGATQPLDPNTPPAGTPTSDGDAVNEAAAKGLLTRGLDALKSGWAATPSLVKWPVAGVVAYKVGDALYERIAGKKKKK